MIVRTLFRLAGGHDVAAFTVHEPPEPPADRIDRAEALVFVPDGFSLAAALFGPFWLAANRMWTALAIYIAVALVLALGLYITDAASHWQAIAQGVLALLLGFEADSIRRWSLEQQGYDQIGAVVGHNVAECERRFFETWLPGQPMLRAGYIAGTGQARPRPSGEFGSPVLAAAGSAPMPARADETAGAQRKPSLLTRFLRGRAPAPRDER